MNTRAIVLIAALALVACGRGDNHSSSALQAPPALPLGKEQPAHTVDSIFLSRDRANPDAMIIRVGGTVWSAGWTSTRLLPLAATGNPAIQTYQLVATSPKNGMSSGTSQPTTATLRVDPFPPAVKTVRIVATANVISAAVPVRPIDKSAPTAD